MRREGINMAKIDYVYFGGNTKSFRVIRWFDGGKKVEVAMAFGKTRILDVEKDDVVTISPTSLDDHESVGFSNRTRRDRLRPRVR